MLRAPPLLVLRAQQARVKLLLKSSFPMPPHVASEHSRYSPLAILKLADAAPSILFIVSWLTVLISLRLQAFPQLPPVAALIPEASSRFHQATTGSRQLPSGQSAFDAQELLAFVPP